MYYSFVLRRSIFPPFLSSGDHVLQGNRGENDMSCKDCAALWVQFQNEFGTDPKVAATASDAPEKVRIGGFVGN